MKKLALFFYIATISILGAAQYADPYKVILPLNSSLNGSTATLINFDTGLPIDSVTVTDGAAVFEGKINEPFVARIYFGGKRSPQFILESGSIAFNHEINKAFGSPLNDAFNQITDSIETLSKNIERGANDDIKRAEYEKLLNFVDNQMRSNIDNPIGYLLFLELAYSMDPKELVDFVENNKSMAAYQRVNKLVESNRHKAATGIGSKYVDFEIEGKKLSDYVGKDGKYLLVDFFASWCGPCIRQLPVLKELYSTYADKLNVLGVAVWDEPEASLRAVEQHNLTWPVIINAGTIPTDIYGISGIPCIMLISPDGTILSRDLQGDDLKQAVASEINK